MKTITIEYSAKQDTRYNKAMMTQTFQKGE